MSDHHPDPRVLWPASNLRELGGYPTPHGPVRHGVLFRGGRMDDLGADGRAVYRELGLHTVVDLRRPDEVTENPTPRFGDERNVHLSVSTGNTSFAEAAARADHPDTAGEVLATAADYYRALVTDRLAHWRPVLDVVFETAGRPLLFHCTAGKDRTGFLSAMLLEFLDVDDDTVFADFELTNSVREPFVEQRLDEHRHRIAELHGIDPDDVHDESLDAWRSLMSAPVEFLRATFDEVERTWGDWHTMRRDGLGIDDDRLAAWRRTVVAEH